MTKKQSTCREDLKVDLVPLDEGHLDRVIEIENRCFSEPWSKGNFRSLLDNPDSVCLAAMDKRSGTLVGYSCAWQVCDNAELGNIAVIAEHQGRAVGRKLLEETMRLLRERKADSLFLEVRSSNSRAIDLYRRYGFETIGCRRGYYSHPQEDALVMKIKL